MSLESALSLQRMMTAHQTTHTQSQTTTTATQMAAHATTPHNMTQFYIGLGLAIGSSIFIGTSFILKKKALLRLAASGNGNRAGAGGYGYLRDWMWWSGVLTMGVGEACNFTAYAFAPASLVTPLGALSVLVTTVLSSRLLNEKLNLLGKIGCTICLLGSTVIVLHSPKEDNVDNMAELGRKMQQPLFIMYVGAVILLSALLIVQFAPRYGNTSIVIYIAICSLIGSLSVLGSKGFGLAIKQTIQGDNQMGNVMTWVWLVSIVVCVSVQLNYLNRALDVFNTAMVTPIYYVFFTSCVILASGILYGEWAHLSVIDIFGSAIGFLITVIGLLEMQLFRNIDITWRQVQTMLRKDHQRQAAGGSNRCSAADERMFLSSNETTRSLLGDHTNLAMNNNQSSLLSVNGVHSHRHTLSIHDARAPGSTIDRALSYNQLMDDGKEREWGMPSDNPSDQHFVKM